MKQTGAPELVLLAMLKAPRPGTVKTRLALEVGASAAATIYRRLVEHQMLAIPRGWQVEVHFSPIDAAGEMRSWLGGAHDYHPQLGEDLGERLTHAIAGAFARGGKRVIVIGGDCPGLDEMTLGAASRALDTADVVIGPALDGGYYLIGLKRPAAELFRGIAWSSPTVLESTLSRLREAGLSYARLPAKEDVDDLTSWEKLGKLLPAISPSPSSAT